MKVKSIIKERGWPLKRMKGKNEALNSAARRLTSASTSSSKSHGVVPPKVHTTLVDTVQ